jgi:hypothetical protein
VTTSLPDPLAELRRTRPTAPPAVRERVRAIAARRDTPARRLTRPLTLRRALIVLVPAVLAVVVGGIVFSGRGHDEQTLARPEAASRGAGTVHGTPKPFGRATTPVPQAGQALDQALSVPPGRTRLQDYDASLTLKVKNADALSDASKRALAIARALGGYASAVSVNVEKGEGDASIRLRIPVQNVQRAVARLSGLGTITGESVHLRDLQAGVNQLDRRIARLQKQLRALRAQEQTDAVKRQIASLTAQVERLQRGRGATVREARLATVDLSMTTREQPKRKQHHEPGPLHGAWVALAWMGIGALYALIVGTPLVLLAALVFLARRTLRRRREEALLSESG